MVASKIKFSGICAWLVLLSASCSGEGAGISKTPDVAAYLQDELADSVAAFGEKLEKCHQQAQNSSVPLLDKSEMQRIGASEEQIIVAIGHMNFTNNFECSRIERTALAFDLEMLNTMDASASVDGKDLQALRRGLIYPSINELNYSVQYRQLPSELKTHIESIAGDKPFDLLKALEENRLVQD